MEIISLGRAGFQCTNLHIKTAQERDSARGGVEGELGNEGCFLFDFP